MMTRVASVPFTESRLVRDYVAATPKSAALHARALESFPNGVTHVGRFLLPYPVYVKRGLGSRKWDVDGNEYVDYFGGHGALLLGHNHPEVLAAVREQVEMGAHYGASHELEVEWADLIRSMIPCAEKVRFTVTGTEATMLGMRLARAYTGRTKVLRFLSHFHGWHDQVSFGRDGAPGILPGLADEILLVEPNDVGRVRELCESREDVAAVMLEPTGATFGQVPAGGEVLRELREITAKHGVLLLFDEVISGFRVSRGGAQQHYGVTPDLATLAKVVAGGYPGAAVVGRAAILDAMEYVTTSSGVRSPLVPHQGTYNAGPVSAAAGIATLRVIRDTDAVARANVTGEALRREMNAVCRRRGVPWCVYGEFSAFHIFTNPGRESVSPEDIYAGKVHWSRLKGATPVELLHKIRLGFLNAGVDVIGWPGGVVSAVHGDGEVERTVSAFESLVEVLEDEGEFG